MSPEQLAKMSDRELLAEYGAAVLAGRVAGAKEQAYQGELVRRQNAAAEALAVPEEPEKA